MGFKVLSDEDLIEAYLLATETQLDDSFVELLLEEIKQRNIKSLFFEAIN